jgi:hypothetical protein
VHPKELIIETLRKLFSQDSYYHYVADAWGYPNTPENTDLPLAAGLNDNATTRVYIGETYRTDIKFYPSVLIKSQGSKSVPISMSRNKGKIIWRNIVYTDGYGNETILATPDYFVQNGAWEGSLSIDISARSIRARDEIAEIIMVAFDDLYREDLQVAGVFIKSINAGSPSETEDRNDRVYKVSISIEVRSESERRIPINNVVDAINVCVDIGHIDTNPGVFADNMRISTSVELLDAIVGL